jgi:predicted DNA binding CopG/RHH family protein
LDWAALDRLIIPNQFDSSLLSDQQRKLRGVQAENYEDAVVACNYRGVGEERFYVMKIRQDLTPHSLPQNKTERTAEYLLRKNNITVQLAEQPMLDVRYCSKGYVVVNFTKNNVGIGVSF